MTKELSVIDFNEEQVALIKSQIAPKATDAELQLFLYQAKRTGLDPLTRQIYAIHRNCKEKQYGKDVWVAKMTIQTSIDGFRVIAERSGDYGGQDEPIFEEVNNKLIRCKVAVYRFRGDVRYQAAVGVAYFAECSQTNTMWNKMPHIMLSKVAEALALRKAYPQDLSGLYTSDEMNQADPVDVTPEEPKENKLYEELKEGLKTNITAIKDLAAINSYYSNILGSHDEIRDSMVVEKNLLSEKMKELGLNFDTETKLFVNKIDKVKDA